MPRYQCHYCRFTGTTKLIKSHCAIKHYKKIDLRSWKPIQEQYDESCPPRMKWDRKKGICVPY